MVEYLIQNYNNTKDHGGDLRRDHRLMKKVEEKMDKTGGLENNDLGALTKEQQTKLNEYKVEFKLITDFVDLLLLPFVAARSKL